MTISMTDSEKLELGNIIEALGVGQQIEISHILDGHPSKDWMVWESSISDEDDGHFGSGRTPFEAWNEMILAHSARLEMDKETMK